MFYSQFILAKKGPLGTIWIAAHLERKLRKNQVADTDIGVSVDSILFPDAPIALRLSSHLLLGVVRIYSKKVNYLFDDCSEALLKIKQAFRSTAVDLPPEESTAPYHSITLPETLDLDDFEIPDTEILRGNFVDHHVSTKEQITLQETLDGAVFSTSKFGLDERFGDGDTSHVPLDFEEDLLLGKIPSQFDEIPEVSSAVSHPLERKVPDDEAQAPSTPGLVSEPNIVTGQKGRDATSEESNYIMEMMVVDSDMKLPEDSECVLRPCTSIPTENDPAPGSEPVRSHSEPEVNQVDPLSDPEAEPVKSHSDQEVEPVKTQPDPEVELVKSHSEPEVEPVTVLSEPEVEPVKFLSVEVEPVKTHSDTEAEPVKSHSDSEVEPVKLLSNESAESHSEPETELVKFHEESPVEPVSLVSKTTPETVSGRSRSAKRKFLERMEASGIEETIPQDDDLLSTILGGRRPSSTRSKRPATQDLSSRKRTKSTPRVSTVKRKVLVDDSMGLLGDTIRNQLKSTADIRRLRKKAPCTLAEFVAVERLFIDDEIFREAVFSGTASDLRQLHFDKHDLIAVRMEDDKDRGGNDDDILEEGAYRGDKCADAEFIEGKNDTTAITVEECGAAGDLDSTANENPATDVNKEENIGDAIDDPNEESTIPEPQEVEEIGDSCAPVELNRESAINAPQQVDESAIDEVNEDVEESAIDELNEELAKSESQRVEEVSIAVDGTGCASTNDEHGEDNFIPNSTEFLTIDDEDDGENDVDDGEPLDNSGWSSRTRAVANYLQQLFNKEIKYEKNGVSVDALLRGKTSKEASRMFFETLVLKTKDYIQVHQGNPYDQISVEPRLRLMKSEF